MSRNFDKNLTIKVAELPEDFSAMRSVRAAVFQLEQGIEPELDFDGKDETSDQILAYMNAQPIGTARIRYLDDRAAKIERLAVLPIARGKGIGKLIMEKAIELAAQKKMQEVVLHSQEYIQGLHQKLGFEPEGAVFEEAGIPHVKMRKKLGSTY
ncbi:GNAT family N-acetyltransferase [Chroococcidiopsis sp. FACHB-1243]|uniref:GNAT family N-acetyltransferase n=1 Tax=Chroococcidiopsis sp. [FACHB-1243] TaxID=2692781 RepID=UPI00177DE5E6|nr:GNAT family N-acetyltransferase [Chroococcidiopsis sp. [FACHB-1243]]MBD2303937.1 GNAT family N-acetyltransferase [Chroococcidiopsis sp. [FACHB-1243]]